MQHFRGGRRPHRVARFSVQANEWQGVLQARKHLCLERHILVPLRLRIEHGHARITARPNDAALVREVVRAAHLRVRPEGVPHDARRDELVRVRGRAVVDRRVVHVHDRARGQERARRGRERGDELGGELRVDVRGEGRGRRRVRLERRVRHLGAAVAGDGDGGNAVARALACSTAANSPSTR